MAAVALTSLIMHMQGRLIMKYETFARRFLFPALPVLVCAGISWAGYFGSRHVESPGLASAMALVFGTTYFISIAFGPLYVYTIAYLRGASLLMRILSSGLVPFLWMTKEVISLTHAHPFIESLYWYVSPLHLWLVMLMGLEMGGATLIARKILKNRGERERVISAAPLVTMALSLTLVIGAYAWGKGENFYVIFLEGYRFFFGSGL